MDGEHPAAHLLPSVVVLRRRATLAIIALGAVMLARGASLLALEWSVVLLRSIPTCGSGAPPALMDRIRAADAIVNATNTAIAITFVVTAIVFLRWMHRLVLLTRALDAALAWSPSEAVWSFIIPLVGLVRPYQILSAVHTALAPENVAPVDVRVEPSAQGDYRSVVFVAPSAAIAIPAAPVAMWWGAFILLSVGTRVVTMVTTGAKSTTVDGAVTSYHGTMLADAVAVIAAALAIMVVRGLTARAVERFRRIRESTPEALAAQGIRLS